MSSLPGSHSVEAARSRLRKVEVSTGSINEIVNAILAYPICRPDLCVKLILPGRKVRRDSDWPRQTATSLLKRDTGHIAIAVRVIVSLLIVQADTQADLVPDGGVNVIGQLDSHPQP